MQDTVQDATRDPALAMQATALPMPSAVKSGSTADTPAPAAERNDAQATSAAFFRVEGTLLKRGTVSATAWFAANALGTREKAFRLGHVALAAAGFGLLKQNDRTLANRMAWAALRGMSDDRLHVLAEEYVAEHVRPNLLDSGLELVKNAQRAGHRIVLVSESIDRIVDPLAELVRRVDEVVCNRLEMVGGETTGRLVDPVVGGHDGGRWIREFAAERGIGLERSIAYGCHGPDLLMLAAVGQPCAVNPDYTLRRAATESRWAILDYPA